jgi:hypothetical protein
MDSEGLKPLPTEAELMERMMDRFQGDLQEAMGIPRSPMLGVHNIVDRVKRLGSNSSLPRPVRMFEVYFFKRTKKQPNLKKTVTVYVIADTKEEAQAKLDVYYREVKKDKDYIGLKENQVYYKLKSRMILL